MIFKKSKKQFDSAKLGYFPQRDVKKEPITLNDVMEINAIPKNSEGKDYLQQHLHYINTMVSRDFVYSLSEKMLEESAVIKKLFPKLSLSVEQISVFLAHGYCFAMTESLFDIARQGFISSACLGAIWEMTLLSQMQHPGKAELILHCLYRGFEISRNNVPVEND